MTTRAVLPALAEVADAVSSASDAATSAAATALKSDMIPPPDPWSVNLWRLTFALAIFCTLGTLVLTWDSWRNKRNEKRQMKEWEAAGGVNRPLGGLPKSRSKRTGTMKTFEDNRQTRRFKKKQEQLDKKMRQAEERAKKERANKK